MIRFLSSLNTPLLRFGGEGGCPFYRTAYPVYYPQAEEKRAVKEEKPMRGYYTAGGYYGLVGGRYRLFASESDYIEFMSE